MPERDSSQSPRRLPITKADKRTGICHPEGMTTAESLDPALHARLIDALYIDALVMADEARSYFDRDRKVVGRAGPVQRLSFTCESLKVTTRLMHVISWLMAQKAWQRGEITREGLKDPKYHLGRAAPTDERDVSSMPVEARELVRDSQALYERVQRLQKQLLMETGPARTAAVALPTGVGPARELMERLEKAF